MVNPSEYLNQSFSGEDSDILRGGRGGRTIPTTFGNRRLEKICVPKDVLCAVFI